MTGRQRHILIFSLTGSVIILLFIMPYVMRLFRHAIQPIPVEPPVDSFVYISPYDTLFRQYADTLKWDWKLLAAIAFIESRFDSSVVGAGGARGLMQMMPRTARIFGAPTGKVHNPQENIKAAVYCLKHLDNCFKNIRNPRERINLVLKAYNAGIGNVRGGQTAAKPAPDDPARWKQEADSFLVIEGKESYLIDSVATGKAPNPKSTSQYVERVLRQWAVYQRMQKAYTDSLFAAQARKDSLNGL